MRPHPVAVAVTLAWLAGLAATTAMAADLDLSHYRPLPECAQTVPIPNGDVATGGEGWALGEGWSVDSAGGRNGSAALRNERTDRNSYVLCSRNLTMEPGATYRFGVWVRTEGISQGEKGGATIALEGYGPQYLGGGYPEGSNGTVDWTHVTGVYTVPRVPGGYCLLSLYLRRTATGRAWFDDVTVEQLNPAWDVYLLSPAPDFLPPAGGALTFGCFPEGVFLTPEGPVQAGDLVCRLGVQRQGQDVLVAEAAPRDGRLRFSLPELPPGAATLELTLLDPRGHWRLAQRSLEVTLAPRPTSPNACVVDERGRLLVAGKPFMPVGIYHYETTTADLDRLAASPFNCLMDYTAMRSHLGPNSPTDRIAGVREALDALQARGLKCIFSVKDVWDDKTQWHDETIYTGEYDGARGAEAVVERVVTAYRDHPAIIAWYMNDEYPATMADQLLARRRLLNRLDPSRPTWSGICQYTELPRFGGTCDALGLDPYPIQDTTTQTIMPTLTAAREADRAMGTRSSFPLWCIPKAHNLGMYDAERNSDLARVKEKWRDPTEAEMLAQALVMAIHGAKGFIYYSLFDLTTVYQKRYPQALAESERRWQELCRAVGALRAIEPYLMSAKDGPALEVKVEKGQVEARAFADEKGRVCVLLVGIGPGPAAALVRVPNGAALQSRRGTTQPAADGWYRFAGIDVCCDILEAPLASVSGGHAEGVEDSRQ